MGLSMIEEINNSLSFQMTVKYWFYNILLNTTNLLKYLK